MIRLRASVAILACMISAFTTNSMTSSMFPIWLFGVGLPVVFLLVSDGLGFIIEPYFGWILDEVYKAGGKVLDKIENLMTW